MACANSGLCAYAKVAETEQAGTGMSACIDAHCRKAVMQARHTVWCEGTHGICVHSHPQHPKYAPGPSSHGQSWRACVHMCTQGLHWAWAPRPAARANTAGKSSPCLPSFLAAVAALALQWCWLLTLDGYRKRLSRVDLPAPRDPTRYTNASPLPSADNMHA